MGIIISIVKAFFGKLISLQNRRNKYEVEDGVTLFDVGLSPPARRVRITLLEKQIPFKLVDINLLSGEQYSEEYGFVNPNRKVPAIAFKNVQGVPDGFHYESNVITELLDSVYAGPKLYSCDRHERAEIRMWQDYELGLVDDFVPLVYQNFLGFVLRMIYSDADEILEKLDKNIPKAFHQKSVDNYNGVGKSEEELNIHATSCYRNLLTLERGLEKKKYLVGNRFTAADLSVFPRIHMFVFAGLPITEQYFPNITKWIELISSRRSVAKSEDLPTKFQRFLITYFPSIFVLIGNVKSGQRHHKRLDGAVVIDRAVNETAEYKEKTYSDRLSLENQTDDILMCCYPVSSDSLQIQLLLEILGIKYQPHNCHVLNLIGRAAGSGGIFFIYHKKQLIRGMRSILEYICEFSSNKDLLPIDPSIKAKIQSWQAWEQTMYIQELSPLIESDILSKVLVHRYEDDLDELLNERSNPEYQTKFTSIIRCFMMGLSKESDCWTKLKQDYGDLIVTPETLQKQREYIYQLLHYRLQHLDNTLQHEEFLVGNSMTLADLCVFCRLIFFTFVGMKISAQKYPNVTRWILHLQSMNKFADITETIHIQINSLR